jgi:hypothetical protein
MARAILDAVEKLLQFGNHTDPEKPISRADLAPVFSAVASALDDLDRRVKEAAGEVP